MHRLTLPVVAAVAGGLVGLGVGSPTTALLAAVCGYFLGETTMSLRRAVA